MADPLHDPAARQATYDLLARLYLREPDEATAAELRGLPRFAPHLPAAAALEEWLEDQAVEYHRLFGMNVYPYESIFIDRELMLNTDAAERVARLYQEAGFDDSDAGVGAPDHLGLELRFMRDLIAAERRAVARGDRRALSEAHRRQARLLREHLARWVPVCALTVERVAREPLYRLLSELTVEFLLSDLEHFPADPATDLPPVLAGPASAIAEPEEEPGLGDVVRQLITPVEVGLFLTRADLQRLAGGLGLPLTTGTRFQTLRDLFEVAALYEQLPAFLAALARLFTEGAAEVDALRQRFPAWGAAGEAWQARLAAGQALVATLREQAALLPSEFEE